MVRKLNKQNSFIKKNRFIILILLFSALLMFPNIGNRYIWTDTSLTALLGKNVLDFGLPVMWDGEYLIYPETPLNAKNGIFNENAWLSHYITAGSYALFGYSVKSCRLVNAFLGLLSIGLFYYLVRRIAKEERVSKLATVLMATSYLGYLHFRMCRYFAAAIFLVILSLYLYLSLLKKPSLKNSVLFAIAISLSFHNHIHVFFLVVGSIVIHFILFYIKDKERLFSFLGSLGITFILTFPWFVWTGQLSKLYYASQNMIFSSYVLSFIFKIAITWFYYLLLYIPFIFLFILPWILFDKPSKSWTNLGKLWKKVNKNYALLLIIIIFVPIIFALLSSNPVPSIRKLTTTVLPAFLIINAAVLVKIWDKKKVLAVIVFILLISSNLLHLFPIYFLKFLPVAQIEADFGDEEEQSQGIRSTFVDKALRLRFYLFDYLYEITHDIDTPEELISKFLLSRGSTDDIFLTNIHPGPIRFHTGMIALQQPPLGYDWDQIDEDFIRESKIDWVIIRRNEKKYIEFVNRTIDLEKYEKFTLNINDDEWINNPNPIHRMFKTSRDGEVVIYHLRKN